MEKNSQTDNDYKVPYYSDKVPYYSDKVPYYSDHDNDNLAIVMPSSSERVSTMQLKFGSRITSPLRRHEFRRAPWRYYTRRGDTDS